MIKEFENELETLIKKHNVPNVIIAYADVDLEGKQDGDVGTFVKGKLKLTLLESLTERIGVKFFNNN